MKHLICPLCKQPLLATDQGIGCANRHQFDRAREGYFNLLPVQHKNSREPGDARQQLQARRAFLQAGFFSPLMEKLQELIPAETSTLLDIGCGEGYFTQAMSDSHPDAEIYGLDISKAGVRLAARSASDKLPQKITYIVASSYTLPLADSSVDVITRIYAPSKDEELQRVLKPQGKLIIVTPGERHLLALRQQIYRELRPHPKPQAPLGFREDSQQQLSFSLQLPTGDYTRALLQMTPFAWRLTPAILQQIIGNGLQDTADFQLSVYRQV
ncbi:MAG TPA: methyltransferase domain-containing protein [Cellvibrio sp.]|nr:methyltransferase domain-containing protein [Cellvibrio sp.]